MSRRGETGHEEQPKNLFPCGCDPNRKSKGGKADGHCDRQHPNHHCRINPICHDLGDQIAACEKQGRENHREMPHR